MGRRCGQEVEQAAHALQAAFQEGDSKTISALVTDDHVSILSYAQFYGRADLLAHLPQYRISNHTVVGMKTMLMSNDSALVVYSGTVQGTYAGRKVPTNVIVTEAWVKQNGT
jgi:hypothetical protein